MKQNQGSKCTTLLLKSDDITTKSMVEEIGLIMPKPSL